VAGRPILQDEESELKTFEDVAFHRKTVGNNTEVVIQGLLIITNFRLIKLVENQAHSILGWEIHLRNVSSFSRVESMFVASKRINLNLIVNDKEYHVQLKFNKGGKDDFIEVLQRALTRRSWEAIQQAKPAASPTPPPFETASLSNVGIGGILARQSNAMQSADNLTRAALTDLESLAQKAREVVNVVQRYASFMQETRQAADEEGLSETSSQIGEVTEMEAIMQNIGVISPVTRLSAGRLYHQQVSRQLAEVLMQQSRLQRLGGMITLTDLYYLYNRARGTELLSPDDLLSAVEMMFALRLGMRLRSFPSGVKVVQLDSFNDAEWDMRLKQVLESAEDYRKYGITATGLARAFNISITLAKERLLEAERRGHICRDESIEGLSFFINCF
jgi:ESCRT-II complex subunit VPS36